MLRVASPLDPDVEDVVSATIGCCIEVHRALGPGLLESPYRKALSIELNVRGLGFEREKQIPIVYKGHTLTSYRLDLVIRNAVVVEIKSVDRLAPVHRAQVLSYLRAARLRIGLLVNFNVAFLPDGIRRVVL